MNFENPFNYSELATANLFINRGDLTSILERSIASTENLTIYGQRRVGKSSLVAEAIRRYKTHDKKHIFILADLSLALSGAEFIDYFCRAINLAIKNKKPLSSRFANLSSFVRSIKPIAKVNSLSGEIEYSFDFQGRVKEQPETIDDVLDLLESIAKDHKVTVVFDEFQNIFYWDNSTKIQWQLRSRIQKQSNIGYIFLGSSTSLISKLFTESKSAFYKSTILLYVPNQIDYALFAQWIKSRFATTKLKLSNEVIMQILNYTKAHPYYTQKLCSFICLSHVNGTITLDLLNKTISNLMNQEEQSYYERIDQLSLNQKKIIKALANINPGQPLFGKTAKEQYSLPAASSLKLALNQLCKHVNPLIYKDSSEYCIEDPFFRLWLQSK